MGLSCVDGLKVAHTEAVDAYLSSDGRVNERLSWHLCEGYPLPDR